MWPGRVSRVGVVGWGQDGGMEQDSHTWAERWDMESTLEVGWCAKVIRWLARLEGGQGLGTALALPAACLGT